MARQRIVGLPLALLVLTSCVAGPAGVKPGKLAGPASKAAPVTVAGQTPAAGASPATATPAPSASPSAPAIVASPSAAPLPAVAQLAGVVLVPDYLAAKVPILSNNGGTVIANNGGGIVAHGEADPVGHNGGAVVANNGSGIVGDAGHSRRLLATGTQVPAAHTRVRLLDGAGNPVNGPDGQPLAAITDDQGHYRFDTALPARNLVAQVDLADGYGALQAVVAKDAPAAASAAKTADVDLISTLTTSYILAQYVKPQKDPSATLDKLPASVEADTLQKAKAAFATAGQPPDKLTPDKTVPAVDALRQKDPGFDSQMAAVKKLLVAAGESDFGNGRKATEVNLGRIDGLVAATDGGLFLLAPHQERIWHLRTDGVLETAVGAGQSRTDAIDGKRGPDVSLRPIDIAMDDSGRLLILEADRLSRLKPDGTLELLSDQISGGLGVVSTSNGDALVIANARSQTDSSHDIYRVTAGKAPVKLSPLPAQDDPLAEWARAPQGKLYVRYGLAIQLFDPDAGTLSPVMGVDVTSWYHRLERTGDYFYAHSDGQLHRVALDTNKDTVVGAAGGAVAFQYTDAQWQPPVAHTADGTIFMAGAADHVAWGIASTVPTVLYRVAAQGAAVVAGMVGLPASVQTPNDIGFVLLNGLTATGAGDLYISDMQKGVIYHVGADKHVAVIAGEGNVQGAQIKPLDGSVALQDPTLFPGWIRLDNTGQVCFTARAIFPDGRVASQSEIDRLSADGHLHTLFSLVPDATMAIADFAFGPDGTLFVATDNSAAVKVLRIPPGTAPAQAQVLVDEPRVQVTIPEISLTANDGGGPNLAIDKQGGLLILGNGQLRRWTAADGLVAVAKDDRLTTASGMALDATGRVYYTRAATKGQTYFSQLVRFDPAAKAFTVIAGQGGTLFSGNGVDDGMALPTCPAVDKDGAVLFVDTLHEQVKTIPAAQLP